MTESIANSIFGRQIGRFILLEKLGEGGMATVYNAYDSHLERNVALKVILPSRQSSRLFLDRFMTEARSLAQLSHTNIVKVLDYGEENGVPYLVMEYIPNGTLRDAVSQALPWDQAAAILAPIARALDYVHKQQIVHRDVKPSNILLNEHDQPMLSDFGVVKWVQENEADMVATGVGVGTPDYMSPEQGMGKEVSYPADIYALGVVFYELVTGQKPYTAETPMAVIIKHVTGSFPHPRSAVKTLPRYVEDVILRATAKDPKRRFQSMADFAEALEELARAEKVRGKRARGKRVRKLLKPRRSAAQRAVQMILILLAVFAVIGGSGAAAWLYQDWIVHRPEVQAVARYAATYVPDIIVTYTPTASPIPSPTQTSLPTATREPTRPATLAPTEKPSPTRVLPTPTSTAAPVSGPSLIGTPPAFAPNTISSSTTSMEQTQLIGIGGINDVAWSPDGSRIALGSTDGIFIYDAASLQRITHIYTNEWVETVTFIADGSVIVSGLRNGKVIAWDVGTHTKKFEVSYRQADNPKEKERLGIQASPVTVVAIGQNGRLLGVGHENGTLSVWNIKDNQPTAMFTHDQYPTVTGLAFSSDGRSLYVTNGTAQIFNWDLATGQKGKLKAVLSTGVTALADSIDGSYLLAAGGAAVFVIDPISERTLTSFSNLGGTVSDVAISDDSARVAAGLANGQVKVFDMPGADQLSGTHLPLTTASGHLDAITGLGFSPDGAKLVSSSWKEGLKTWETSTGASLQSLDASMYGIYRLVFSLDDQWLAAGYDNNLVRIWNTADATLYKTYSGHIPPGDPFSPKQHYLVLVDEAKNVWEDGPIYIIEYPSGEILQTLKGYHPGYQVRFDPDEKMLVVGDTYKAKIWDTSTWEKMKIQGGPNTGCGLFTTPEFEKLALIWDKAIIFKITDKMFSLCANKPTFADPMYLFRDQSQAVYQTKQGILWVWDMDKETIDDHNPHGVPTKNQVLLAMSADDQMALVSQENTTAAFGVINKSGFLQRMTFPRQADYQYSAAFSNNSTLVALGSRFGTIAFWSVR